jgi:hypothetical protein
VTRSTLLQHRSAGSRLAIGTIDARQPSRSGTPAIDFPRHRSAPRRLTFRNAKATFNEGVRCRRDAKKRLVRESIRVETMLGLLKEGDSDCQLTSTGVQPSAPTIN